ncbi:MAG: zinc-binding dehydrogenase [Candidatus Bathyarchaeia archaeon]
MLALKLYGKENLSLEKVEEPTVEADEAILRVRATNICATDIKAYTTGARTKVPIILGHEFAGDIIDASPNLKDYIGKRVVVDPDISDGNCEYCLRGEHALCPNLYTIGIDIDGSFAEYVKIPGQAFRVGCVQEIPDNMSYEEASLVEPFASCFRGQRKLEIKPGDVVTIIGAGPIGLMHLKLAKLFGASKVIMSEIHEQRIEIAEKMGADYVINPMKEDIEEKIMELTNRKGSDAVIVAVASPQAQKDALRIVRRGGKINFFAGLPAGKEIVDINTNIIHYKQIILLGTSMPDIHDFKKIIDILSNKIIDVKPFITHTFSLHDGMTAFSLAMKGEGLKIQLKP